MNFNGLVGDLGSRPSTGKVTFNVQISCSGDENNFITRCLERYKDSKILNSSSSRSPMGGLVWNARIEKKGAGI